MSTASVESLGLPGVMLIHDLFFEDGRGGTIKNYDRQKFLLAGIDFIPTESLLITSHQSTLRGLHFQKRKPQSRLLTCIQGEIFVVVVNVCSDSGDYGRCLSMRMSSNTKISVYVPQGYALGTLALRSSLMHCLCDGYFCADDATGIRWDDETLCIEWPLDELDTLPVISEKDRALPSFRKQ